MNGRRRMLAALRREAVDRPPVWFMRQAGRHLPRYRAIRETVSFMDLCRDPGPNAEVSAEPTLRYGLDAAIVFNDILIPLRDMGMGLDFSPGPRFDRLISSRAEAAALAVPSYGPGTDVCRCLTAVRSTLGPGKAVLGFIGSPFTVATFAIAGAGTQRVAELRRDAATRRDVYEAMQERLTPVLADYAVAQVRAGADVIQVFESLAHDSDPDVYRQVGLPSLLGVIELIRRAVPETPVIAFGRGIWDSVPQIAGAGVAAISLDETRPLSEGRRLLREAGFSTGLQGNLPPEVLLASPAVAATRAAGLLRQWPSIVPHPERASELGPTGWVFNLGHGVPATASPETVQAVVDSVRLFRIGTQGTGTEVTP